MKHRVFITDRKSYAGSRLPSNSMTLDDLERQNRGFLWIFWRFRAARHISRANCAEINGDRHKKLHIECSALNVDFNGSSPDFLGLRKPAHEGIK